MAATMIAAISLPEKPAAQPPEPVFLSTVHDAVVVREHLMRQQDQIWRFGVDSRLLEHAVGSRDSDGGRARSFMARHATSV